MNVIDPHTQTLLQDILRRESRSALLYMADAYPWTTATQTKTLTALQQIIAEERDTLAGLGRFLGRHRIPLPMLGFYPSHFTTMNFIALDYLLPRLIEHQRCSLTELERDAAALKDPAARTEVEKLLEIKRRHLAQLEELAAPQPQVSGI